MSDKKIIDLSEAERKKRRMNGWTLEEIHGIALKELHEFSKIAAENEPENLAY